MSHISKIELEINDLESLKLACDQLGLEFRENQKTFEWYGGRQECEHAIRIPGATYEIGVIRKSEGKGYQLVWDNYHRGGLEQKLGGNAGKLKQAYARERIRKEARVKGYRVLEQRLNQGIRLVLTM